MIKTQTTDTRNDELMQIARGNIPNIQVALECLQSLVEGHGARTDQAALDLVREALQQ